MHIISGSSNINLAKKISQELKSKLLNVELSRFSNAESRVWVKEKNIGSKVAVVQSFSYPPDDNLIEFCLICDALKRMGVNNLVAVIPWLSYCIQDKVFRLGEPLSAKVIAKLIQINKLSKIITLDLHNETMAGFFDIPFIHLSSKDVFIEYFKKNNIIPDMIVSPDIGSLKRAGRFAQDLSLPVATIDKKRNLETGEVTILGINGIVKNKKVLIYDDFISTGSTLVKTAKYLKEKGASMVSSAITHHFYIKGVQEKIEKSNLNNLYVTDTISQPNKVKYNKLTIISVAKLIADNLRHE